jgi:outer membrane receptor protein involved in Fe transport
MKRTLNGGKLLAVAVSMLLVFPILALAQATSTILGVVKDASGGVVAGAAITVQSVETAQTRTVTTGDDGAYQVPALQAGHYTVRVEKAGFQTTQQQALTLDVAQTLTVNLNLQVGTSSQQVVVSGEATQIDTTTSTLGGLVNDAKIADLPLNGRNYIDLSLMQAGVEENLNQSSLGGMQGTVYSSNGAPTISNNFTLDGTSISNQSGWGTGSMSGTTLGVDGIKEYKVITNAFPAEYGMTMGSQMVMVSKGGSNQFHGDVFEYLRTSALNARNFFDPAKIPQFEKNNFGGSVGGPIRKDKTFFYAVYEGLRIKLGFSVNDIVPPAGCHALTGTLSNAQCSLIPVSAGAVPVSSITAPLQALYPIVPGSTHYSFSAPDTSNVNYGQIRIDHNFSASDSLFGRYTTDQSTQNTPTSGFSSTTTGGTAFPGFSSEGASRDQFLTLSENHIFSTALLNGVRISFSRTNFFTEPVYGTNLDPSAPPFVANTLLGGLSIGGLSGNGGGGSLFGGATDPTYHIQNIYSFADDVFYTRGKHELKFGTLVNRYEEPMGGVGFSGSVSYADYTHFLEAIPSRYAATTPGSDASKDYIFYTLGYYAQDNWRATSRLTVNMGLRYEFTTTPYELNNKAWVIRNHGLDPAPTQGPVFRNATKYNFSPRVGIAWDVFGDGKTSFRAATGIYYDIANYGNVFVQNAFGAPPLFTSTTINNGATTVIPFPIVFPANSVSKTINISNEYEVNQPTIFQLSTSIERQLPGNMALSLAFVHTRGTHLWTANEGNLTIPTFISPNGMEYWSNNLVSFTSGTPPVTQLGCENVVPSCRINPNYLSNQLTRTVGDSWYNGLQVSLNKRLSRGLEFQAAYTYSHSVDTTEGNLSVADCSSAGMDETPDPIHPLSGKGPSCFDLRHNVRFNLLYHFPNWNSNSFLTKISNGWWMGNIVSVQGGYPFTPLVGVNRSNSGVLENSLSEHASVGTATVVPGQVGPDGNLNNTNLTFIPFDPNTVTTGNPQQWFNPLMFAMAPMVPCPNIPTQTCGTLGTASRGMLRGPGLGTWDFSLVKDTALGFFGRSGQPAVPGGVLQYSEPRKFFAAQRDCLRRRHK